MAFDRFRRHRTEDDPAPSWAHDAASAVAAWEWLDDDLRERLVEDTATLTRHFRWEAANGFEVTAEMQATIAAHAAVLTLALGPEWYDRISSVIVHPTTFERSGEYDIGGGIVSDDVVDLLGEADPHGPIVMAWDAVRDEAAAPEHGRNVVYHEFAHQLDMRDGWVDGTPPLHDRAARERWVEVCTREFERLRSGDDTDGLIDRYAATDPGEFFAVLSELFFTLPFDLADEIPDLYDVMADFYLLDPAASDQPEPPPD